LDPGRGDGSPVEEAVFPLRHGAHLVLREPSELFGGTTVVKIDPHPPGVRDPIVFAESVATRALSDERPGCDGGG
jgi:hypothetical protein